MTRRNRHPGSEECSSRLSHARARERRYEHQIWHVSSRVDPSETSDQSSAVGVLTPDRYLNMLRMIQGQSFRLGIGPAGELGHVLRAHVPASRRCPTPDQHDIVSLHWCPGSQGWPPAASQRSFLRWAVIAPCHFVDRVTVPRDQCGCQQATRAHGCRHRCPIIVRLGGGPCNQAISDAMWWIT